jgi:hypothetical protein
MDLDRSQPNLSGQLKMVTKADVIAARIGHVVAPAGCGKTQLIADSLAVVSDQPVLILTHTTAGVAVLRNRLKAAQIPSCRYRLNTIAGWALSMISMFPERAGYQQDPLAPPAYTAVQTAIGRLCASGDIQSEIQATYQRLMVDEYQDCSQTQHQIIFGLAQSIPTVVFGDPLQAVFGFNANDPLPDWNATVASNYPLLGELTTPWRWNNADAPELGKWLLAVRAALIAGQSIDLRSCPGHIHWQQLTGVPQSDLKMQVAAQYAVSRSNPNESLLIIGDSINTSSRHQYAKRAFGVGVVEPVDYRDVITSANAMTGSSGPNLLQQCIAFLKTVMTNVSGDNLQARVQTIMDGRNRTPPTPQESGAIMLSNNGGHREAMSFLQFMEADPNRRVYRWSAYKLMLEAFDLAASSSVELNEAAAQLREQRRHSGRSIPNKAVGSTLLLKGLEADHTLLLDADNPGRSRMTKEHLYVALSRGAKSVTVFSRNPTLP